MLFTCQISIIERLPSLQTMPTTGIIKASHVARNLGFSKARRRGLNVT